jgi:hypothetical protein
MAQLNAFALFSSLSREMLTFSPAQQTPVIGQTTYINPCVVFFLQLWDLLVTNQTKAHFCKSVA